MKTLIITFVGNDQSGLVDKLSKLVRQNDGNWQKSSLHQLSGAFAGVIEVSIADDKLEQLTRSLQDFPGLSFQTHICQSATDDNQPRYQLEIMANDRTGIVQEIASAVHACGGNLLKLVSKQQVAPHTGQVLFKAKATVAISEDNAKMLLTDKLETIADDLMVEVTRLKV